MITDAGMRQQAGLQQQRLGVQAEMQDAATQARAGAARDKMQRDAAEFSANAQIKDRDFELRKRKQEQTELDAWRERNKNPNPTIGGYIENANDPMPQFTAPGGDVQFSDAEDQIRSGKYYYTPNQKREQAKLDDLVSVYQGPGDPRFNEPQRQSILEQIQGRRNGIKPVPRSPDDIPVPPSEQAANEIVNRESLGDTPIFKGQDGNWQPVSNSKTRLQMMMEGRNNLTNQLAGVTNAEGQPVYSPEQINEINESLYPEDAGGKTQVFGTKAEGDLQIAEWKSQGFTPNAEWGPDGYTVFQGKKAAKKKEVDPLDKAMPVIDEWMADKTIREEVKSSMPKLKDENDKVRSPTNKEINDAMFAAHDALTEELKARKAKQQEEQQKMMTEGAALAGVFGGSGGGAGDQQAVAQQLQQIPQGPELDQNKLELENLDQRVKTLFKTDPTKISDEDIMRLTEYYRSKKAS